MDDVGRLRGRGGALNEFRPPWATHVVGRFPDPVRDAVDGFLNTIRVEITCEACGAVLSIPCSGAAPRAKVLGFATHHVQCVGVSESSR